MGQTPYDERPGVAGADDRDASMIRREEELRVRTVREATGRVRLRKRIVEEERTFAVVVQREEVEISEEGPTGAAGAAGHAGGVTAPVGDRGEARAASRPEAGAAPADADSGELVLFEQRPVVTLEWVPVERVRLDRTVVTEQQTVEADVRREVVEEVADDAPDEHLRHDGTAERGGVPPEFH